MWSASVVPELMIPPVTVPISKSTIGSAPLAWLQLPSNGFNDVMQQWHLHTELSSLSSITRAIGYLLVLTTSFLELPHIYKILRTRTCEGVSLLSTAILLLCTSANVAYCINRNLPLSTWAESVPLMIQYITLMCLLLLYTRRERCMLQFVVLYVLFMLPLLLGVMPGSIVCSIKVLTLPLTLVGKVNQMHSTYKRGGTGQMSKKSIFQMNMRCGGRLLTSSLDTYDTLLVLYYAHACLWNTLITGQMVFYGHKRRRKMRQEERKRRESAEHAAALSASSDSSSSDSDHTDSETGTPRIRRRRRYNNAFTLSNAGT